METVYADFLARLAAVHSDMAKAMTGLTPEQLDWSPGPEMNALSVLATHTAGAERFLIGELIGGDPVVRDRAAEFMPQYVAAAELVLRLDGALAHTEGVLDALTLADLEGLCAPMRDGTAHTRAYVLAYALDHTALHLGHMQITRQLLDRR
jgi:hypothetical protein